MKLLSFLLAALLGAAAGESLARHPVVHRFVGRCAGCGPMVALVGGRGVFRGDLRGQSPEEFVASKRLAQLQPGGSTGSVETARVAQALRSQFGDEKEYRASLRAAHLTPAALEESISAALLGEQALEQQIANDTQVSPAEVAQYFSEHTAEFLLPLRLHLRHIFFAAPAGTAAEIVQAKEQAMTGILRRLGRGEDFAAVAAAVSEDEATQERGGDLGWIEARRTPSEIFHVISSLKVGAPPAIVTSHLGLHAVQVVESKPPRTLTLEEATPEIVAKLSAHKRKIVLLARQQLLAQEGGLIATAKEY